MIESQWTTSFLRVTEVQGSGDLELPPPGTRVDRDRGRQEDQACG